MTAITEANAKKLSKSLPFFRQMSKHGKDGWYKWLENFDDTTGDINSIVGTALAGTTGADFTVDSDNTDDVKIKLATNTIADGNYTLTITPLTATWGQNTTLSIPDPGDSADTFVLADTTQTLTGKTLTTPTIGDFTNATHTHADAANGGAITASASLLGTTNASFTVNYGGTTPEIAIGGGAGTGNYTLSLISPTLSAAATITMPAVTGTLATLAGTESLSAKTLVSPVISTGLTASGSAANTFAASTGTFITSSGANTLSGDVTISGSKTFATGTGAVALNGSVTIAATKTLTFAQGAGASIIMNGETSGGITISPAAVGTSVLTLVNPACVAPATITMPNATATLATLGLVETFSGNKTITGTLDIRGNVSSGASNPNIDLSGSSGTFLSPTGEITLGTGAVTVTGTSLIVGNATTPILTIESGKTNTGYIEVKGKTNGMLKIMAADSTAQTVTFGPAAQTSGAGSATIPDLAGGALSFVMTGGAQTVAGVKTLTSPPLITVDDANDTVIDLLTLTHSSSDNGAAAGSGIGIVFQLENAVGTSRVEEWARLNVSSTSTVDGAEDCDVALTAFVAGTLTPVFNFDADEGGAGGAKLFQIGSDANAVSLELHPATTNLGTLRFTAANSAGDTVTTVTNASQSGARTYTIPDAGASASFVMSAGASTIAGARTFSTMPIIPTATVAAAGSVQADAAAITTGFTLVTNDSAAKGIALPAAVAGAVCIVKNSYAGVTKVWPANGSGDTINGAAGDATMVGGLPSLTGCMFVAYDETQWFSIPLLPS